jgi:hypothetical protein
MAFNGLHGVVSQKRVLFITTTLRTSNPSLHQDTPEQYAGKRKHIHTAIIHTCILKEKMSSDLLNQFCHGSFGLFTKKVK